MKSATSQLAALATATLIALAAATAPAGAQEAPTPESPLESQEGRPFALGFQSSWPAYGISGIYDVTDKLGAQLVLGAFGNWTTFTGRGLYRLSQQEKYGVYGFGSLGFYSYSYNIPGASDSESSLILGAGGGMEFSLPALFDDGDFPPVYWSAELGFTAGSFEFYDWRGFTWGSGLHYRF